MKKFTEFIKKHKKGLIILAVILAIVIVIVVLVHRTKKKAEDMLAGMAQETYVLEKRNLVKSVSSTGKISSVEKKTITVASMNATKVATVNVSLGDTVKEGDIICTFDTEDIERNLANAKTDLAISQKKTANSMDTQTRGLHNSRIDAVNDTNRNLEAVDEAKRKYDTVAGEKAEASRIYDEVEDIYEEYWDEDEYYDLLDEYQEVKDKLSNFDNKTTSTTAEMAEFAAAKEALSVYIEQTDTISLNGTTLAGLEPGQAISDNLDTAAAAFANKDVGATTPEAVWNNVKQKISELRQANARYISAVNATAANLEEYNNLSERSKALSSRISNMETAKSKMESAKSNVDTANNNLNSAGDTLKSAQRKQEDDYRHDVNSVKDTENNYDSARLDSSVASRTYEDNVRKYEQQLEDATVRAPFAGVITAVNVEVGDLYAGAAIVTVEDLSSYVIEADIDEYDISKVEVGQKVTFKTNSTGDEELEAEVTEIAPRATTAVSSAGNSAAASVASTATYRVKMLIRSDCKDLRLDMTAKVNIIVDSADNVYAVPFAAVQTDDAGEKYIEIEDDSAEEASAPAFDKEDMKDPAKQQEAIQAAMNAAAGNAPTKRIPVTVGVETDYYVEIESPELYDGMSVIVPSSGGGMDELMSMMGAMGGM